MLAVLVGTPGCMRPYLVKSSLLEEARLEAPVVQSKLAVEAWPVKAGQSRYLRYSKIQKDLDGGMTAPGWTAVRAPAAGRPLIIAGSLLIGAGATLLAIGLPVRGVTATYYVSGIDGPGSWVTSPIGEPISNGLLILSCMTFGAGVPLLITGLVTDPLAKPGMRGWLYLPRDLQLLCALPGGQTQNKAAAEE